MTESPRPSRDEVGYALVAADKGVAGLVDARRLAAEVRALRAELAEIHDATRPCTDPSVPQRRDDPEEIQARIAALETRAPQPAVPAHGACGDRLDSWAGNPPRYCELPARHDGWHEAHGTRWSFDPDAVTPPAAEWLIRAVVGALTGEDVAA